MQWIIQNWEQIFTILFALILVAEIIVNLTPSEKDNSILLKIKAIISAIAPNRVKKKFPDPEDDEQTFETTSRVVRRRRDRKSK